MLLALVMAVSALPVEAFAVEAASLDASAGLHSSFVQINPLYEDVISEEDLPEPANDGIAAAAVEEYCATTSEAADQLRESMKDRSTTVEIGLISEETITEDNFDSIANGLFEEMFSEAMAHTGVATEGDYLRFQYGGLSGEMSGAVDSEGVSYITYTLTIAYYTTAAQETAMDSAVDELLADLNLSGASDYEKIKAVYDYICANVTYDYTNLEDDSYLLKYTGYAALLNGTAVCQGYAVLFYRLMLELGIDARVIASIEAENHAWNIVGLDDLYYNMDATWDAGMSSYSYFLRSPSGFPDHTRAAEYETAAFHAAYPMSSTNYGETGGGDEGGGDEDGGDEGGGDEGGGDEGGDEDEDVLSEAVTGTCDNGFSWVISTKGTLTITGEGEMEDYDEVDAPWYEYKDYILAAEVGEGITYVGKSAFCYLTNLAGISLPSTLTEIGTYAFGYTSLESLTIPEGVTALPDSMCADTQPLTTVTLPSTLKTIGSHVFSSSDGLTNINIPEGVTSIGEGAFYTCNKLNNVVLPSTLTSIGTSAFASCKSLTAITIPAAVTELPSSLFSNCTGLEEVTLPEGLTTLDHDVFTYCTSLTALELPESLTSIGLSCFHSCTALESITIPDGVTELGNSMFYNCTSLKNIILSDNLTYLGNQTFGACESLESIVIPASVTELETMLFYGCDSLSTVTFLGDAPVIGDLTFNGITADAWYPADNATWTADVMQNYGGTITWKTSAAIVASGTCGDGLDWKLDSDGLLTISGTGAMTDFAERAPWYDYAAQIKTVAVNSGVTSIGAYAFFGQYTALTAVSLPDTLTTMGEYAFSGCTGLEEISIPAAVTSIGVNAFYNCASLTEITVPAGVTAIGNYTFHGCTKLERVELPDRVTSIGSKAFYNCGAMTELALPASLTSIGTDAFYGCAGLTELTLPEGVTTIGGSAFQGCTGLERVNIPGGVTQIDAYLFYGCSSLKSLTIPDSVTKILNNAFYGCSALTEITLPDSVDTFGTYLFYGCSSLKEVAVPSGVTDIGIFTFGNCSALTSVTIPEGVTGIGQSAFSGCASLTSVALPESLETIASSAFSGCNGLTSVTVPAAVTEIGTNAFYLCTALTNISFSGDAPALGSDLFYKVTATACYPAGNETWTADVMQNYGGTITWKALCTEHIAGEAVEEKRIESTCTAAGGYDSVVYCTACGTELSREKVDLELAAHTASEAVQENVKDPTCTEQGHYEQVVYCSVCQSEVSREVIPTAALGHTELEPVEENRVESTCTVQGHYEMVTYCAVCGQELNRETSSLELAEHTAGEAVTENQEDPACGQPGSYDSVIYCTVCGTEITRETVAIDALEHVDGEAVRENVVEATCAKEGSYDSVVRCTLCGAELSRETLGLTRLEHTEGESVKENETASTCTVPGSYDSVIYCTDCRTELSRETVSLPLADHTPGSAVKENVADGSYDLVIYCAVCSEELSRETVALDAPQLLGVETVTANENGVLYTYVSVSWTAVEGAENYEILRGSGDGSWESVGFSAASPFQDLSAELYTEYTYTVRCVDDEDLPVSGYDADGLSHYYPSGACGNGTQWKLTADGLLTISGSGAMASDWNMEQSPWYALRGKITGVDVGSGITSIAPYAFQGCTALESVTIADTVDTIGQCAFFNCNRLKEIAIPEGVTEIPYRTFYLCSSLETVELSSTVTAIGNGAFDGCAALSGVALPEGLVSIGQSAFGGCTGLTAITIPEGVTVLPMNVFSGCTALTQAELPEGLTTLGAYAFANCRSLTGVELPESLSAIGIGAFSNCAGLTELTIPAAVTSVGRDAFGGCADIEVSFLGEVPEGSFPWFGEESATIIFLRSYEDDWLEADFDAMGGDVYWMSYSQSTGRYLHQPPKLLSVSLEEGGIRLEWEAVDYAASYWPMVMANDGWHSWGGPSGITETSYLFTGFMPGTEYLFTVCALDEEGKEISYYDEPGLSYFYDKSEGVAGDDLTWSYQDGVLTFTGTGDMYDPSDLELEERWTSLNDLTTEIILPEGLTSIGGGAFAEFKQVTEITIPTTVTRVGEIAFYKCDALEKVCFSSSHMPSGSNWFGETACAVYYPQSSSKWTSARRAQAGDHISWIGWTPSGGSAQKRGTPIIKSVVTCENGVNLTWLEVDEVDTYAVFRAEVGVEKWGQVAKVEGTSYLDTSAVSGKSYRYTIRSMDGSSFVSWFDPVGLVLHYLKTPTTSVYNHANGVLVKWTKTAGAVGYRLYRRTADTSWTQISTIKNNTTFSYVDTSVKENSGETYIYAARAYNGSVTSWFESNRSILYLAQPKVTLTMGHSGVFVKWNEVAGAEGYRIYRKTKNGAWTLLRTVTDGTTLYHPDTTIKNNSGTTYYYTVRAYNGSTQSTFDANKTIKFLLQPTPMVKNVTNGIQVTWNKVGGAAGYRIYRRTPDGAWTLLTTVSNSKAASYVDTAVKTKYGQTYIYTVRAYSGSTTSTFHAGKTIIRSK